MSYNPGAISTYDLYYQHVILMEFCSNNSDEEFLLGHYSLTGRKQAGGAQ